MKFCREADDPPKEDGLKNKDNLKQDDDLKNEEDLKNEKGVILKKVPYPSLYDLSHSS